MTRDVAVEKHPVKLIPERKASRDEPGVEVVGQLPATDEKPGLYVVSFETYPQVNESHRLDQALKQIEREFGLTPSARVRMVMQPKENEADDSKERFFRSG